MFGGRRTPILGRTGQGGHGTFGLLARLCGGPLRLRLHTGQGIRHTRHRALDHSHWVVFLSGCIGTHTQAFAAAHLVGRRGRLCRIGRQGDGIIVLVGAFLGGGESFRHFNGLGGFGLKGGFHFAVSIVRAAGRTGNVNHLAGVIRLRRKSGIIGRGTQKLPRGNPGYAHRGRKPHRLHSGEGHFSGPAFDDPMKDFHKFLLKFTCPFLIFKALQCVSKIIYPLCRRLFLRRLSFCLYPSCHLFVKPNNLFCLGSQFYLYCRDFPKLRP